MYTCMYNNYICI